ncbi:MAG: maturation of Asn-linked oligosaccharides protein [Sclerophora amabilis]|nr:MAG: maturation of Asn-linked oligosaccharides protein [Sclerophora amabilis]
MRWTILPITVCILSVACAALPPRGGHPPPPNSAPEFAEQARLNAEFQDGETSPTRAEAVKEAFNHAWAGYYQYAFPSDELRPVSIQPSNSRNAWGASAVDALSTALLMELPDVVDNILDYIPTVDFSKTATQVSLFETTIRYLGGMLAAYDLLKGPLSHLSNNTTQVDALLSQSVVLADVLKFAFDTPSGIPSGDLNITNQTTTGKTTNSLAGTGTLVMEWTRLSDLTGDGQYARLAQIAESYLLHPKPADAESFPGLVGSAIDINTGNFTTSAGSWGASSDSFYEYLIKMYVYDQSAFSEYKDRWVKAADSTIAKLTSHPSSRKDITFVSTFSKDGTGHSSQHLTCFDGGNFLLGGRALDRQDYIDYGLALVDGCHKTYNQTATRIGPESFRWTTDDKPSNRSSFEEETGFAISGASYNLRPEVVESYYYAYRITGDKKYQDWAWDAFVAINATTRTDVGFSSISDVNVAGGGRKTDFQESFVFAEVFKYSYLIQAPDAPWQISKDGADEWVYNTEAHPFKVRRTPQDES